MKQNGGVAEVWWSAGVEGQVEGSLVLPEPPIRLLPPRSPHSAGARVSLLSVALGRSRTDSSESKIPLPNPGLLRQGRLRAAHPTPHRLPAPASALFGHFNVHPSIHHPIPFIAHPVIPVLVMPSHPGRLSMKQANTSTTRKSLSRQVQVRRAWPLAPAWPACGSINQSAHDP